MCYIVSEGNRVLSSDIICKKFRMYLCTQTYLVIKNFQLLKSFDLKYVINPSCQNDAAEFIVSLELVDFE